MNELIAVVNTYAYFIAQKVYVYCLSEYETLEKENRYLRTELTRARNRNKSISKDFLEEENKRLRKQNQEQLELIKNLRSTLRKVRGLE